MQTSNPNQNFRSKDPVWVLLAKLSFSDCLSAQGRGEEPAAGFLFQSLRELGMSPEGMESIAGKLAGFAKEARARAGQGRLGFPGQIRIFCQKKMIEDANAAKLSRAYRTEQAIKDEQISPDPGANKMGGWGYFTIEKGGTFLLVPP